MNVTEHIESGNEITLRVTDHTGANHRLTLTKAGEVTDHWCDQYPRGDTPTPIERERLTRVERFAKFYLDQEYETEIFSPYSDRIADPNQLTVTGLLVAAMSQGRLKQHFETYYEQLTNERNGEDPPISPPQSAPHADWGRIEQDMHLTIAPDAVDQLGEVVRELDGFDTLRRALDIAPDRDDADLFERLTRILENTGRGASRSAHKEPFLRVISPVRVHWQADGPTRIEYGDGTEPTEDVTLSARVQLTQSHQPVISLGAFQRTLVDHLRCQIRDCYVGMGVQPPSDVQITGPGIAACTELYESVDELQNYHDEHAIIDWTQLGQRRHL